MARETKTNAFVVLGIVLLVVGGLGAVYGQLTLTDRSEDDGSDSLLEVTAGDDSAERESASASAVERSRLVRLGGLVVGVTGAVVALVGGLVE